MQQGRIGRDEVDFLSAVGLFVLQFSFVEAALWSAIWATSGLDRATAQAVLTSLRVNGGIDSFRRVLEAKEKNAGARKEMEELLLRLSAINKIRNELLHHSVITDRKGNILISNRLRAFTKRRLVETIISTRMLDDMSFDLTHIGARLANQFARHALAQGSKRARPLRWKPSATPWTWRHTPLLSSAQTKKQKRQPQGRSRPPPPSQA